MENELLTCKFCGKVCKNNNSLAQHTIRCHHNPNRINNILSPEALKKAHEHPWNKGLTKETDERVKQMGISIHEYQLLHGNQFKNKKHTKETREKIAQKMKNNKNWINSVGKTGFGKRGYYKGIHCDSTYELVFLIYCLDHNIKIERCCDKFEYYIDGQKHFYIPDFKVDDVYIEIKVYWNKNKELKEEAVRKVNQKLKIYYANDLQPMFQYVCSEYNLSKYTECIKFYDKR